MEVEEESPTGSSGNSAIVTIATAATEVKYTEAVYTPPFKLTPLHHPSQPSLFSEEGQRASWEALRKSVQGLINKVNIANIKNITTKLYQVNLIRGRGLFAQAIMEAQLASPGFTHVYAALVAAINTGIPEIGAMLLNRMVYDFKSAIDRHDTVVAGRRTKFIAHLDNHRVAHEALATQLLDVLLAHPTGDRVEIAADFTREACGD
jgi:pre-mRNA-splicing factor CWC22